MSWQDELRKLDDELAAGQISADDYRRRRDQVLSSAVSPGQDAAAGQQPAQEATQLMPPVAATPPDPQQARPAQPAPATDDADKTQIVPGDADRTQAVGGWQAARPVRPDLDRTQAVPGVPPQAYVGGASPRPAPGPGQFPPPPGYQQGWHDEASPPWAGADFPPLAAHGNPDWIRQGPEVFESGGTSHTVRNLLIVLVVVLVVGAGVGAYFLFVKDNGQQAANQPPATSAQPPTTSARPKDDLEVADLPGTKEQTSPVNAFADAAKANFLTSDEIQAYEKAGATKCRLTVTLLPDQSHAYIFTARTTSTGVATAARDGLAQLQLNYGLHAVASSPPGVVAAEVAKAADHPATIRAHYVHGGTLVRIQVYGDDLAKVRDAYDQVLSEQLKALSASA